MTPYVRGLHEIGDGCYAYLQPGGGWGWSNAGLVVGDGASLLVDTLFDLRLTAAMLDAMAAVRAAAPIATVVAVVRDYLVHVDGEATARFRAGMDAWDAARDIALGNFASLGERGRIAVNVEAVYRGLDPAHRSPSIVELFQRMAALER